MPKKRIRTTRRHRRKSNPWVRWLSLLFVLLAISAGAYWGMNDTVSPQMADAKISHVKEGTVEDKDAIYTDTTKDISEALDTWLRAQDAEVTTVEKQERTEPRHATGGTIQWTTYSKEVIPAKPFTREDLEQYLAKSNGKAVLYRVEKTLHNGQTVTEYDIAYFDMLDTEQLYLVTDRLYVTAPKEPNTVVASIKKLIQESTSGSLKDIPSAAPGAAPQPPVGTDKQRHPAEIKGRLAIVIDDCGSDMKTLEGLNKLPIPLTYAVMPNKPHTAESAESGYNAGRKIFVHLPMEALQIGSSEKTYIAKEMSDSKVKETTNSLLDQVPHAVGMNNHQGSLATADARLMNDVMAVLKQRHLVYLDSRTNKDSVGEQTASAVGIGTTRNNLFIDNDHDVELIKNRLRQGGQIAKSNGSAVVIGHCRPYTLQAIKESIDELHKEGIDLVFVTDLMQ